jgi:hypothetical protein
MTDTTTEGQQDVFDDTADTGSNTTSELSPPDAETADSSTSAAEPANNAAGELKTGAKEADGTPPEDEDDQEAVTDEQSGKKFIPEHRFKAALKKVTDELEATKGKLTEYEKPEPVVAPDRDTDPEGFALHTRMEASKAVMIDLCPDYQDVINHFATMSESNPLLNQAVADHPIPAKLAYDIAKKDLEIKEAMALKSSDDWKEFQEYKKSKTATVEVSQQAQLANTVKNGLRTVPNLNRSTNASPNRNVRAASNAGSDDTLWDDYKR